MKGKLTSVIIATFLVLVGCQATNNDQEGQGMNNTFERTRTTHDNGTNRDGNLTGNNNWTQNVADRNRNSNNRPSNNTQDQYDVSEEAANRIVEEMADIDRAYVLTTRNNAYVAATLNKDNTTPKDNLTYNDRQNSSAGMNVRNVNDRNVKDRTVNEGDANQRRSDNHSSNRRDQVSDEVEKKRDVESDEVTDEVKNQIADIVQDVDNNIDNVYVSTSPDFFDLTHNYVTDMNNGKPVRGFFDQIGNTIERIFPQNKR
ncbi:YhcN/YlaJ family sporulation lipoprotein [Pseudogracilibacillus sp. SE30717A]|uniref:YhcN/YlaJ family sporulation lipoprotein n=1 Tax=Pseudogracilibacillus sp. SE30717A TaxID=3098293 RepID=UPI00300E1B30